MSLVDQKVWEALRDEAVENEYALETSPQDQGNSFADPRDNETLANAAKVFHDF